jgi:hypothetical protein
MDVTLAADAMKIEPFERAAFSPAGPIRLRWHDDFYRSIFMTVLQNARRFGIPKMVRYPSK